MRNFRVVTETDEFIIEADYFRVKDGVIFYKHNTYGNDKKVAFFGNVKYVS